MISASMVKELRETTGAGMLDCKKALEESNGNMEEAITWLREKGISKAAKKSSRIAGNDDAVKSIKVVLGALTNAIAEATGKEVVDYVTEDESKKQVRNFERNDKSEKNNEKKFDKKVRKEVKTETVVEKPEVAVNNETKIDLTILTVSELRELAKKKEIKGYSKLKKEELIDALK